MSRLGYEISISIAVTSTSANKKVSNVATRDTKALDKTEYGLAWTCKGRVRSCESNDLHPLPPSLNVAKVLFYDCD